MTGNNIDIVILFSLIFSLIMLIVQFRLSNLIEISFYL